MKKYFFGISAIAVAVVFSAFTLSNRESKINEVEDELYWYRVDGNGKIALPLNSETLSTKSEVFTEANCPDNSGDDCARGYEAPQTFGVTAPGVSGTDRHIRKD
jgi:hypothetical protein